MIHFTRSFSFLVLVVAIALEASTVAGMPLPFQQSTMMHPPRITFVKPIDHQIHKVHSLPPRIMIKMTPESSTALRGSTLASRQVAEAKKDQDSTTSESRKEKQQPLLFSSRGSDESSTSWMMDGLPSLDGSRGGDPVLMLYSSHENNHGDSLDSQKESLPTAILTAGQAPATTSAGTVESNVNSDNIRHDAAKLSQQHLADEKGSPAFPLAQPITSTGKIEPSHHEVLSRVTVIDPASRRKAGISRQRRSLEGSNGNGITIKSQAVASKNNMIQDSLKRMERQSIPPFRDGPPTSYIEKNKQDESYGMIHQHQHRRLITHVVSAMSAVGQLAILQPVMGTLGSAGVSQLVAHLVLAPMSSAPQRMSMLDKSSGDDETSREKQGDSFLLAPSSASNGVKLQMIEVQPSHSNTSKENWKYVKFQATLTSSDNKPHLYCAAVQPSDSLQMELCDEEAIKRSFNEEGGASKIFLYDQSTGEVVPSQPSAPSSAEDDDLDSDEAKQMSKEAEAVAQVSSHVPDKRQTAAAGTSSDSHQPRSVKLVFMIDPAEQTTATNNTDSPESSMNSADRPPLLRNEQ